jgi:hypothetical protein
MGRAAILIAAAGLASAVGGLSCAPSAAAQRRPALAHRNRLNTLDDIRRAIRTCWRWPPASAIRTGMTLTVLLSFKRDGEIFGARITYQTRDVSPNERALYYGALVRAFARCNPLPFSPSLRAAVAGHPFYFRFRDTRMQRKV